MMPQVFAAEQVVNDIEPKDPFAENAFESEQVLWQEQRIKTQFRMELKSYYQQNNLKSNYPFNPTTEDLFANTTQMSNLDVSFNASWSDNWSTRVRQDLRYENSSIDNTSSQQESQKQTSTLLEGVVQYQSDNKKLNIIGGRNKPQWSTGINFDIANILQPQRSQPYIDVDAALTNKGWDMLATQYIKGQWSFGGYLIRSESPFLEADTELVLRLARQGNNSISFLIKQIEHSKLTYAATWSRLLSDSVSLRSEWTYHDYRVSNYLNSQQDKAYQRLMTGLGINFDNGWSLYAEYFYNQHGASAQEWRELTETSMLAAERIRNEQSISISEDYLQAFSGVDFVSQGWLRKNYFSLLMRSQEDFDSWQWMVSLQASLDDSSSLFRFETNKSFTNNLSLRIQGEIFEGCDLCEYGLNPNQSTLRMVLSWLY